VPDVAAPRIEQAHARDAVDGILVASTDQEFRLWSPFMAELSARGYLVSAGLISMAR